MNPMPMIVNGYTASGNTLEDDLLFVNLYVEDGKLLNSTDVANWLKPTPVNAMEQSFIKVSNRHLLHSMGVDKPFYAQYNSSTAEWVPVEDSVVKGLIEL